METKSTAAETGPLLQFLLQLGRAYLACGEQTATVESFLQRIAIARGMRRARVVSFPTAIFITVTDEVGEQVTLSEGATNRLRLDQIAEIYTLGDKAQRGGVSPRDGLERLEEISRMAPRFGAIGVVLGHVALTLGLVAVLMPGTSNFAAAAILGLAVGLLKIVYRDQPILAAPLSVVAAALVSTLVFLAVKQKWLVDPVYALVTPLVTFLPGAMLAFGLVEMTTGDMVSGSSRLMTGLVQIVLLGFGLTAGALLVGFQPEDLVEGYQEVVVPIWTALAGVALFGIGVFVHYSAPPRSLPWLLLTLFVAYVGQRFTTGIFGPEISGFFGMFAATLLGNVIEHRFRGPPSMVTFLPSFWLLVPTALGLINLKRVVTEQAKVDGLVTVVFTFTAIALGTLVGESLYKWLAQRSDRWRLG